MKIYNYSKFKRSDRKIYNIAGYSIPGGVDLIGVIAGVISLILCNLIVYPISKYLGVKYFDIANKSYTFGIIMIIFPIVIGFLISKHKIKGIPMYKYIIEVVKHIVKPKNTSLKGEKCNSSNKKISFKIEDPL